MTLVDIRTPLEVAIDAGTEFFDFRVSKTLLRSTHKTYNQMLARCFVALFLRTLSNRFSLERIADMLKKDSTTIQIYLARAVRDTAAGPAFFSADEIYKIKTAARTYARSKGRPQITDIEKANVFVNGKGWLKPKGPNNVVDLPIS